MNTTKRAFQHPLNPLPAWKKEFQHYTPTHLQQDLLAGLTVAVVALPLALAFGVTSGAGAAAGLFTAIIAGLLASLFGGSRYQITGPTGAMTVVLIPVIAQYGLEKVFVVGLLAGAMVTLMGILKLGRVVHLIPWPVITGFTNGIAIIIFLQQLPNFLGLPPSHSESNILLTSTHLIQAYLQHPNFLPPLTALVTMAIMLFWPRITKKIPGSIIALVLVTSTSVLQHHTLPRIGEIPHGLPTPHLPSLPFQDLGTLFSAALAIAVLSALESLLSAVVADGMTLKDRHDPDRELIGQGIANLVTPIFGGIPSTGAIARTAVGVKSGAHTRLTGIFHALFLLLIVLLLGHYAASIPLAVLAGILMVTAYRMLEFEAIKTLLKSTRSDLSTMLITTLVTVMFDLILAIEVGLLIAGVLFIQRMIQSHTFESIDLTENTPLDLEHDPHLLKRRVLAYRVEGPLFFGVAGRFLENLTSLSSIDVVILRMRRVKTLDASAAHALEAILHELHGRGITLMFSGLQNQPRILLVNMGLYDVLTRHGHHDFTSTDQAITHAWTHVKRNQEAQ
ncbi:SulP family inorganic anion transporter [Deinococcus roseus]|uniref:MFS transporter n=1 Tax=Deinococcus roseus TaxID=392414 RepID=A0ABQ2DC92_9DEIO|nr:SulP family inorganic anion transporter [Deinococcus roseus]GGJ52549.1 MFS transporter [Deinococcus roseus]